MNICALESCKREFEWRPFMLNKKGYCSFDCLKHSNGRELEKRLELHKFINASRLWTQPTKDDPATTG